MDEKHKERMRELYPTLSDNELEEAAANLDAYLELAWEIYEDMKNASPGTTPGETEKAPKRNVKNVDSIQRKFDSP